MYIYLFHKIYRHITFFLRIPQFLLGRAQKNFLTINAERLIEWTSRLLDDNCALLGYNAASSGNFLPTFRDNLWGSGSFLQTFRDNLPPWVFPKRRCVITQKSAVVIYFAAEAWNHASLSLHTLETKRALAKHAKGDRVSSRAASYRTAMNAVLCVQKRAFGVIAVGSSSGSDVCHLPKSAFQ
jgi:hypothetical protein